MRKHIPIRRSTVTSRDTRCSPLSLSTPARVVSLPPAPHLHSPLFLFSSLSPFPPATIALHPISYHLKLLLFIYMFKLSCRVAYKRALLYSSLSVASNRRSAMHACATPSLSSPSNMRVRVASAASCANRIKRLVSVERKSLMYKKKYWTCEFAKCGGEK